jgi:hypothetical protein
VTTRCVTKCRTLPNLEAVQIVGWSLLGQQSLTLRYSLFKCINVQVFALDDSARFGEMTSEQSPILVSNGRPLRTKYVCLCVL